MRMRIKKDDTVIVITGKDKGKKGKVLRTVPKKDRSGFFRFWIGLMLPFGSGFAVSLHC